MTVVRNRSQDGNRRPIVRIKSASHHAATESGSDPTELPPVLFQLPNLCPSAAREISRETSMARTQVSLPVSDHKLSRSAHARTVSAGAETPRDLESTVTMTAEESESPVEDPRRSKFSRLSSFVMILGVMGLGASWIYVVAKNVRTPVSLPVAEAVDLDASKLVDMISDANLTASLEDTMVSAERLALNQTGKLPSFAQPVESAKESFDVRIDDLDFAPSKPVNALVEFDLVGQDLPTVSPLRPGNEVNITMPSAVVLEKTEAIAASARTNNRAQNDVTKTVASASDTANKNTLELPRADTNTQAVGPVATTTPNALTPPLPAMAASNAAPRRYSTTPTPVSDWLKFLPPVPQN